MQKGIEKAIQKGKLEGIQEGIQKGKLEDAKRLLELGVNIEIISKATGLSIEEIRALQSKT